MLFRITRVSASGADAQATVRVLKERINDAYERWTEGVLLTLQA